MSRHRRGLLTALAGLLIVVAPAFGQAQRTGRSVALAGSGALGMYGSQAVGWNAANLGLKANPGFSLTLLSVGMSLGNNAFSPQYVSDTFVEGDTLNADDKNDILSKMDTDRLKIYSLFGVPVFGLSIGRYALNVDAYAMATASLPADLFDLILIGPTLGTTYDLSTVEEKSLGYVTASISAAQPLSPPPLMKEFAVGASFKYIIGGGYADLEHKEGSLLLTDSVIYADGFFRFLSSMKGDGVAVDLAAAGRLAPVDMYVGATLGNIIGGITWEEVKANEARFYRYDGLDMDSVGKADYWKHFLYDTDTTYDYDAVKTSLPRYLMLSADKPYLGGRGDLFFTYYQGLNEAPGQSTSPRIALGTEFRLVPILPLRAGMAIGGIEGSEYAAGFGLRLLGYQLNIGASWQRGLLAGAQGFSLAITNYFGPGFKRKELQVG